MMFSYFVVLVNVFAFGFGQNLGSKQYCSDLAPQSNLTMTKLTGTWFGAEIITHHDRVTGEKSTNDCVYVIITEIYQEMATLKPPENPKEIVTQFGPRTPPNTNKDYRYLKLDWIELDGKWEYILRYNISRNGFWLASAPHEPSHYSDQPSFGAFTGTIQVIIFDQNYMVLTFCENVSQQQLFSIILARHSNSLSMDIIKTLRDKLRARDLPNVYYRRVCSGVDSIGFSSNMLVFAIVMIFTKGSM